MKNAHHKPGMIAICFFALLLSGCSLLIPKSQLPVMVGTALPTSEKIVPDNTTEIIEFAQWIPQNYSGYISTIDVSPDGKFVAVGFSEGPLSVLDSETGEAIYQKTDTQHGAIDVVHFVPGANELLLGYIDGTIALCQTDGTVIWEADIAPRVHQLAISPSGNTIAVAYSGHMQFLSTSDGSSIDTIEGTNAEFLSDEQFILGTAKGHVEIWQLDPMKLVTTLDMANEGWTDIVLSPSQEIVLANSENSRSSGNVRLIRVEDGHYITALWATQQITDIAFSPDSKMIATASFEDSAIQLWRSRDGAMLSRLLGHTMPVRGMVFSADGTILVSGAYDGTIRVWGIP
jgi:WD40 repeat protein